MTKPAKIALGVAVAGAGCAVLAAATRGPLRLWWTWTAAACAIASAAYVCNRPAWLGKRAGRWSLRALVVLPYLVAFRIACALMRWWRPADRPTRVAPGLWVGGRAHPATLPPRVTHVVDLVAEYPAAPAVRRLAGYRSLPVLDGGFPPDPHAFVTLVRELVADGAEVFVHCDSGRGRAPTMAAALLVARGLAPDVEVAVAWVRVERAVARLTRTDLVFLATVEPWLRAGAGSRPLLHPAAPPAAAAEAG